MKNRFHRRDTEVTENYFLRLNPKAFLCSVTTVPLRLKPFLFLSYGPQY